MLIYYIQTQTFMVSDLFICSPLQTHLFLLYREANTPHSYCNLKLMLFLQQPKLIKPYVVAAFLVEICVHLIRIGFSTYEHLVSLTHAQHNIYLL